MLHLVLEVEIGSYRLSAELVLELRPRRAVRRRRRSTAARNQVWTTSHVEEA